MKLHLVPIWALVPMVGAMGCEAPAPPAVVPIRPVVTHIVQETSGELSRSFSGALRASTGVELSFEATGRITELLAKEGRSFDEGDVLARMEDTGAKAELANSQAQYSTAEAELQRTLRLFENANASKSQLDTAMAQREATRANLEIARKRMNDTVLRMPYAGTIGRVLADRQQVISAGTPVVTIQGARGLEFRMGVPARLIDSCERGLEAEIRLGSLPGRTFTGRVAEVSPEIGDNTTYPVTIALEATAPELREGMDGEATLKLRGGPAGRVLIPAASVFGSPGGEAYVWTVQTEDGAPARVSRRKVQSGSLQGEAQLEILSGLTAGELVVTRGVHRLQEGQEVLVPGRQDPAS